MWSRRTAEFVTISVLMAGTVVAQSKKEFHDIQRFYHSYRRATIASIPGIVNSRENCSGARSAILKVCS